MAAFRKRNAKRVEIFCSDATYARVLLVRAAQSIGGQERAAPLESYLDEFIEQRISEDFEQIFGMPFEEMHRRNSLLARILKKDLARKELSKQIRKVAAIALDDAENDGSELSNAGAPQGRGEDPVLQRG